MAELSLRPDQIEDLAKHINNPRHGMLHDPGVGKTPTACVLQQYYWQDEKSRTFWAQPKSLIRKNYREMLKFTDFTEDDIGIYDGTPDQREAIREKDYKVLLMGFDMFGREWDKIKAVHKDFKSVVVDELHLGFKGNESNRTKALYKCMRTCKHFVPMTGSLIDGRLDSAYPTIHVIEPRYYYDHNAFMIQHAEMDDYGSPLFWKNHDKIGKILKKHSTRRTFESVYGKQVPVIVREPVEMTKQQRWAYKEIEDKAIVELDDRFIEAGNPAVASIRCRQFMQHPQTMGVMKENELTAKEEAILIHAENHKNKGTAFVVYGVFTAEQERIAKLLRELGLRVGLINHTVPDNRRADIDEAFQKGELDCIVGSPETASVGFNWHHISQVIYSSVDYRDTNFEQSYKRGLRRERETPLLVTVLEYVDSIDQRIFYIVERKSRDRTAVDDSYRPIIFS